LALRSGAVVVARRFHRTTVAKLITQMRTTHATRDVGAAPKSRSEK
jgi:hypothetical protein